MKRLATHRELAKWCAQGKGEWMHQPSEKRRYRKLKRLNTELDILLKIAELEKQNPEVFQYVLSVIKQMYEKLKEE